MIEQSSDDGMVDRDEHLNFELEKLKVMGASDAQISLWRQHVQSLLPSRCEPFVILFW